MNCRFMAAGIRAREECHRAPVDPLPHKVPTFLHRRRKINNPFTPNPQGTEKGAAEILDMVIALVAVVVAILLGAFLLISQNPKSGIGAKVYSKAEVSLHNKRTDCWIIIKDKVYDVTSYVEEHPGGDAILAHAGGDSTEGFYGPQHATRVFDMIDDFYIGDLEK
ncbi:Cytochrome b5 [Morus notabilis]|uniref:Cytochrome b5 n=1 Tax=Morus notabilis TaxID=981085 RepID=W9R6U1_9ROSA|nr:Cytochrome b5 [Morus notabilis]